MTLRYRESAPLKDCFLLQPVGCDYGIGSGAAVDRCGVCNGDSTACSQIMETFTDDWNLKGEEINTPSIM